MYAKIKAKMKRHSLSEILQLIDYKFGFSFLERNIASNWLNPFCTIYLNLRSFPFKQAIRMPIFVYGRPRIYGLDGCMIIEGSVQPGMIKFNQVKYGAPNNMAVQSEICNNGSIIFKGKGVIGTGNKIRIAKNAVLSIGENFKIADMCNIGCFSRISIGAQVRITHRCQILDSNYHYVANFTKRIVPKWTNPIIIGRNVWLCNTSTITGGAIIPNFTIIASYSLVGKDYSSIPENSMIGGIPAKHIATGFRRVENQIVEKKIKAFYIKNPMEIFQIPKEDTMDEYSQL